MSLKTLTFSVTLFNVTLDYFCLDSLLLFQTPKSDKFEAKNVPILDWNFKSHDFWKLHIFKTKFVILIENYIKKSIKKVNHDSYRNSNTTFSKTSLFVLDPYVTLCRSVAISTILGEWHIFLIDQKNPPAEMYRMWAKIRWINV